MTTVALVLVAVSLGTFLSSFFLRRWRIFLAVTAVFALANAVIAAPLNWLSLVKGHEFVLKAIVAETPPVPIRKLALPTDTPKAIIRKMGCFVCHKIPDIPESRYSTLAPVLIPKTLAALRITSPEYLARVESGDAHATTAKEYVIESILHPNAFVVPGYEDPNNPGHSRMYPHYGKRFTRGGLDVLADFLLTIGVEDAIHDGYIVGH